MKVTFKHVLNNQEITVDSTMSTAQVASALNQIDPTYIYSGSVSNCMAGHRKNVGNWTRVTEVPVKPVKSTIQGRVNRKPAAAIKVIAKAEAQLRMHQAIEAAESQGNFDLAMALKGIMGLVNK